MYRAMIIAAFCIAALPVHAGTMRRCGWLHNPSPANYILEDADGRWWAFRQGGPFPPGFMEAEERAGFDPAQWIASDPRGYGYGCACIDGNFGQAGSEEVRRVTGMSYLPLDRCLGDPDLPAPPAAGDG